MFSAEYLDAVTDYHLKVVAGTVEYPQSSPGTGMPAAKGMEDIAAGIYTGEVLSRASIEEHPAIFEGMMMATAGIHRMVGRAAPEEALSQDFLQRATLFSDAIIKAATRAGVMAYADGKVHKTLRLPSEEDHRRFGNAADAPGAASELASIFNFGNSVAFAPGGQALVEAKTFRNNLKANYARLIVDKVPYPEYSHHKLALQKSVGETVGSIVLDALRTQPQALPGIDHERAEAALTSLYTAMPDPSFPRYYFEKSA